MGTGRVSVGKGVVMLLELRAEVDARNKWRLKEEGIEL